MNGNGLVAFVLSVVYVCLGYALGTYMTRRGASRRSEKRGAAEHAAPESGTPMTADEAATFLERIQQVTSDVHDDVGRHASRVAEISGELSSEDVFGSPAVVVEAASGLLEANRVLQQDLSEARAEIQSQRSQLESYMQQAVTDALTGLANRRGFDQEMNRRTAHLRRGGPPLALLLVDVDHFKQFNDEHGHQAGDAVLSQVADVLTDSTRQMDFLARYGGEEFGVILPGTTLEEAKVVADRIRCAVDLHAFKFGNRRLHVTVSAGLAQAERTEESAPLISRADKALYAAKNGGRNVCFLHDGRVCVPIEKRSKARSQRPESTQRIAPFVDGRFPEPGMFRDISCEAVSAVAFSYVVSERPGYDSVLVALGDTADCAYATATVQECRNIGSDTDPLFRIACRFTAPVDCLAEVGAD
jgi:diguanylate cyclase